MILAIIQARLNSQRLPRKVLLELPRNSGITVLERVIRRVQKSRLIDQVVLAIAHSSRELVPIAEKCGIVWFHYPSPKRNVLDEFVQIARIMQPRLIVRITADCPCIDPEVIDEVIIQHDSTRADYTCSRNDGMGELYGDGSDCEVFTYQALMRGEKVASEPSHFEHVTKVLYDSGKFKVHYVQGLNLPNEKYSLDTIEDYEKINKVYKELGDSFTADDL